MADLGSLLGAAGVGGAIGQAVVRLELDTAKYQAEMKSAQASTVASTNAMGTSTSNFSKFASTAFLGVGIAAAAGVAVSIKAASDLNEQLNKTREVFEGSAETVIRFSETTAESMGISQRAALEYAGSFGQVLDAAGLAESATSEMSTALVQLAADLASFNNLDPTEALTKLQAGLAGQARPLREVGVFLSAARVETKAYELGIAELGAELTDAQKIQARYAIILDDTTKAQGDFQRTIGESLPNQMRVLKAEFEDLAAQLGKNLLPPLLEVSKILVNLVQDLGPILDLIGKLGPAIGFLGEAFSRLVSPLLTVIRGLQQLTDLAPEFLTGNDRIETGLRAMALNASEAGTAMAEELTPAVKAFIPYLYRTQEAADDAKGAVVSFARKTGDELEEWQDDTKESFRGFVLSLERTTDATIVTRREFIEGTRDMLDRAKDLDNALRGIAKEKWVNEEYITFLADLGPENLIRFEALNEDKQRKMQAAWEETTKHLKNSDQSLMDIIGTLDKLDKGTSRHTVIIDYRYEGFDPSKPGMSAQQR